MVTTSTVSLSSTGGRKNATGKSSDEVKLWTKLWVSSAYGGKKHFPEDYERIEKANQVKTTSFTILKQLRYGSEADRPRWKKWYKFYLINEVVHLFDQRSCTQM